MDREQQRGGDRNGDHRSPGAPRPRRSVFARGLSARPVELALCILLSACGSAAPSVRPEPARHTDPSAPGELAMRHPDALTAPTTRQPLGAFATSSVTAAIERDAPRARGTKRESAANPPLAPIRLTLDAKPRPYPLHDGELNLPTGLVIHRVPKGVSVKTAREQQTGDVVWEIADPRGRRLALLKARSFRRAAAATAPVLDETRTLRLEARRNDWGAAPVRVVVDRFRSEHHIYTLERRAQGSAWIWSNLELTNQRQARRD